MEEQQFKFSNDFVFCSVLQKNKDLCKELLEIILDVKIRDISYVQSQDTKNTAIDAKGIRLDVYVENDNNTVFDLEMQTTTDSCLGKRSRYYHSLIDQTLIDKGDYYDKLKTSIVVFICLKDPFSAGLSKYTFVNTCMESSATDLGDDAQTIFLNASGSMEGISNDLKSFLCYVASSETTDSFTRKIEQKVKETTGSSKWRKEFMTLEMRYQDYLEKGKAQGITEGEAKGRASMLVELVSQKLLGVKDAAKQLNISEEAFLKLMQQ